jgi:hypothetical protein
MCVKLGCVISLRVLLQGVDTSGDEAYFMGLYWRGAAKRGMVPAFTRTRARTGGQADRKGAEKDFRLFLESSAPAFVKGPLPF